MLFNRNFIILQFTCQFAMLSNWKFACFYFLFQFSMLLNGKLALLHFFVDFSSYSISISMGSLHFINSPWYSMRSFRGGRMDGRMNRRTHTILAPMSYRTSALSGRCPKRKPPPKIIHKSDCGWRSHINYAIFLLSFAKPGFRSLFDSKLRWIKMKYERQIRDNVLFIHELKPKRNKFFTEQD